MISFFFKKSIKNKSFSITFIIFTILSGAFIGFPLMVSLSNGFTVSMINKVMWIVSFCVYMVVLLILLLILKTIIFDNDLNFLIKNEIQYRVKKLLFILQDI